MDFIKEAKEVIDIEINALHSMSEMLDENFQRAIEILFNCKGKVVVTGMGKSGLIGQKIASTFASTGTPSFFLHPAEGSHGDLGMVEKRDVVMAISNSGETEELITILPLIKRLDIKLISLTGNLNSSLAKAGDAVLYVGAKKEACPLGLAPTASTTAALAMGDALAVILLKKKGFTEEDFAFLHPGGLLGKKLLLKVKDIMHTGKIVPLVPPDTLMKDVIFEISSKGFGVAGIIENRELQGVFTDGDLRRSLEKDENLLKKRVSEFMTRNPKLIKKEELAVKALQKMEQFAITSLFVVDDDQNRSVIGIIHFHDLLRAGIV